MKEIDKSIQHGSTVEDKQLEEALARIGDTDPHVRDNVIYPQFQQWLSAGALSSVQVARVLTQCVLNLQRGIGEVNTDTVFTRSFSALVAAEAVNGPVAIERTLYERTIASCHHYLEHEKDVRGYVEGKGWAHAIAHGADLLAALVCHPYYERAHIERTLVSSYMPLFHAHVFIDDESERLVQPIVCLQKKFDADMIIPFVQTGLVSMQERLVALQQDYKRKPNLSFFYGRTNVVSYVMFLYFSVEDRKVRDMLEQAVRQFRGL
ncbi:DUF2785 domain-containing protein [Bacillus sp. FSL W7-1360]